MVYVDVLLVVNFFMTLLLLLLTAALCLAVLLGGQDFVHALLNVAVLP